MMYGRSPISLRYVALLLGFMIQVAIAFRDIGDLKSSQDEQAVTLPATPHYPGAPGTPTAAQESRQFERDLLCEQVDRKSRRRPSQSLSMSNTLSRLSRSNLSPRGSRRRRAVV